MSVKLEVAHTYTYASQAEEIVNTIRSHQTWAVQSRAEMLIALAEFDYLGLAESYGHTCTAGWLACEIRIAQSTAFEYVGVARQLPNFALLAAAFRSGEMCYSTVRFLLKYLTPDNQEQLVDLAKRLCFSELKKALAGLDSNDADVKKSEYHHDVRVENNGDVVITARLNAADGAAYLAALKIAQLANYGFDDVAEGDLADDEKVEQMLDQRQGRPEECPAEEIEPVPSKPASITEHLKRDFSRFGPPVKADMYSALLSMINVVRTRPVSDLRTPGAHVNIMMTTNGRAWLPGNVAAPSKLLQNYVDNAFVRLHLLDDNGLTLHAGRSSRFVNDGQLRALLAVWGYECAMPGCNHTRFLEVHHITEWRDGGETNLDNLIPLCSSCHSKVSNGLAHISTDGRDIEFRFLGGSRFISRARQLPEKAPAFAEPLLPEQVIDRSDFDADRFADFDD